MLSRSFTRREKVLLLVLAVVILAGLYVLLVFRPVKDSLDSLELQQEDVELAIDTALVKQVQYNSMRSELDEIFALPEDEITVMPPYDNIQPLMVQLNNIFRGLDPQLSFDEVKHGSGVASRAIRFAFRSLSYAQARATLERLTGTGWRCLMSDVTITPAESGDASVTTGAVNVSGIITFYENTK